MEVALDRIEDRRRFPHANRSVMLVAVLFALGGCDKVKSYFDALADDRIKNSLERQISFEVERRLGETRSQAEGELKEIKINLAKLETDSMIAGWRISSLESAAANVRPDGSGYGVAMTKFGPFLVIARSAVPYLDGSKITFEIGNITSIRFIGAKIKLDWSVPYSDRVPQRTHADHSKMYAVTTEFPAGAWTSVDIFCLPLIRRR